MRQRFAGMISMAPDSLAARSVRRGKSPWVDAAHLLWTIWIFLMPVFDHFTWRWLWLTVGSYPLFVLLYACCHLASCRRVAWFVAGMVAMGFVMLPWYDCALVYFTFGCVMFSSLRMSLRNYLTLIALLNLAMFAEAHYLLHYSWESLIYIPTLSLVVGVVVRAERTGDEQNARLELSHEEVRRLAATAERERIGRDLHDLLGHTLSLITLKLELSRKLHERGQHEASRREAEEAERVARQALAEVRAAVTGIRATDLAAELASARLLLESSNVHLDYGALPMGVPAEIERGLALVIREAATNIVRHAGASNAQIAFSNDGDALQLEIADNGRGGIGEDGNGLCGMRERVRALGGTLSVHGPRGQGTRLLARVPLAAKGTLSGTASLVEPISPAADAWPAQGAVAIVGNRP